MQRARSNRRLAGMTSEMPSRSRTRAVTRLMLGAIAGCTQPSSTSIFLAWHGAGAMLSGCRDAGIERFMEPGINGRTNWPNRSHGVKRAG